MVFCYPNIQVAKYHHHSVTPSSALLATPRRLHPYKSFQFSTIISKVTESQMSKINNLEDYRTPTPNTENSKVTNIHKYKDVREREYLTSSEIDRISKAAKSVGRHGHRDSTIIMVVYHHVLRVSELVSLKWS